MVMGMGMGSGLAVDGLVLNSGERGVPGNFGSLSRDDTSSRLNFIGGNPLMVGQWGVNALCRWVVVKRRE